MACKECDIGTSSIYQQDFKCNKWSLKQSATNPKCRLRANIHDESGSIQASIFSSITEKILGFTATEIVENPKKPPPLFNCPETTLAPLCNFPPTTVTLSASLRHYSIVQRRRRLCKVGQKSEAPPVGMTKGLIGWAVYLFQPTTSSIHLHQPPRSQNYLLPTFFSAPSEGNQPIASFPP
ncbi:OLC1v1016107C1 [Oldenlandia corymbosa var. corymbosa]|uniref:OLC1v1016107C1 n=1 Tax=Oldenlandia corymbosa var. corymbosa TaxID=529605 RepID=A0AAV1E4Z3_OLDCO|nr:OLC1v1016107C1 [Oldenlandia corymbosa var. corymbosa]